MTYLCQKHGIQKKTPWLKWIIIINNSIPRSMVPATESSRKDAGKSPDPAGKHGKYLEHGSSIPVGNFPMIYGRILPESTGSCWNPPENSRPEYCCQLSSIFRCIPAVSRRTSFTSVGGISFIIRYGWISSHNKQKKYFQNKIEQQVLTIRLERSIYETKKIRKTCVLGEHQS
jgi:hypothetical protein